MATYATLTVPVEDIIGADLDASRASVWIEANTPKSLVIVDGTTIRAGGRREQVVNGVATFPNLVTTNSADNPTTFGYRVTITAPPKGARDRKDIVDVTTSDFPLLVDANLAAIEEAWDNITAPPSWRTQFLADVAAERTAAELARTGAEAALTQAQDLIITDLGTTDSQTSTLVTAPASLTAQALAASFTPVITPEKYGAVGDGVADDTDAVAQAFAVASALRVEGLGGNTWHPGATVHLRGTYKLTTLAAPIVASCNITSDGATLIIPNAYAQAALLVGHEDSGHLLHSADMTLPNVIKIGATSLPAGGIGVQLQNLHHSRVRCARVTHHETGLWFTALGAGNVYNEFFPGWVDLCKVSWKLSIQTGGWVNQNTIIAGGISQSPNAYGGAATRRSGYRHILLDGGAGDTVHGNTFVGSSLEGDYSEYFIEFKNAAENSFVGNIRFEQGTPGVAATASAAFNVFTIPDTSALAAGTPVVFQADAAPGGVTLGQMYWVYSVTGNDFSITTTPGGGGTILDITSAGTNVKMYRPPTIHFDNSSGFTRDNIIREYNLWPGRDLHIKRTGAAAPAVKATIVG